MRALLALALTGCASQAPVVLEQAKASVDARASYAYYTGWDKRVLQQGDKGNCAAFAFSYQAEALAAGSPVMVTSCKLRNGQEHAFAVSADGWALDMRQKWVVPVAYVGCQ